MLEDWEKARAPIEEVNNTSSVSCPTDDTVTHAEKNVRYDTKTPFPHNPYFKRTFIPCINKKKSLFEHNAQSRIVGGGKTCSSTLRVSRRYTTILVTLPNPIPRCQTNPLWPPESTSLKILIAILDNQRDSTRAQPFGLSGADKELSRLCRGIIDVFIFVLNRLITVYIFLYCIP